MNCPSHRVIKTEEVNFQFFNCKSGISDRLKRNASQKAKPAAKKSTEGMIMYFHNLLDWSLDAFVE